MHDSQPFRRRLAGVAVFFAIVAAATALLALPGTAAATNPCDGDNPPSSCFDTHEETQDVTLTVSKTAGTITSSPSGISCGATCSFTAHRTRTCDYYDCSDWSAAPSYTLTASGGPSGFAPSWGGACSGSTCSVTLDTDKAVSLSWVDVTDPSVSLNSPSGSKVGPSMVVSANASDNAAVSHVSFYVDGVLKLVDSSAPYSGVIDMSSYANGSSHTVLARAYDTSNRISDASRSVTVDKSVSLSVDTPPTYTSAASLPIAFTTDSDVPASGRQCQVNGGGYSPCVSPFNPPIASDGTYTVSFKVTDDVGNTATVTRSFTVDRTAPGLAFTDGPAEGATVASAVVTLSFEMSDGTPTVIECALDGGAYAPCTAAGSETLSGLAPGTHALSVRASDSAGNSSTITRHFAVSQPQPSAGNGTGNGGYTGGASGVLGAGPAPGVSKAKLSAKFKLKGKGTLVKSLRLSGVPTGASVKLRCKGHGCPFKTKSVRPKNGAVSVSGLFKGKQLGKGVTIEIDVAIPGAPTQVFKLTTRAHKQPRLKTSQA